MRKLRAICRLPKRVLINILGNLLCTKHDRSQAIIWHSDFTNSWQRSNCSVVGAGHMVLDVLEHPLCIAPHPQVDLALHIQETYLKRTYARRYFLKDSPPKTH